MRRLERIDLLVVDEVGFVPFDRQGGLSSTSSLLDTDAAAYSSPQISPSPNGRVFGGDESSPPRCSTGSPARHRHHHQGQELPDANGRHRPKLLRLKPSPPIQPATKGSSEQMAASMDMGWISSAAKSKWIGVASMGNSSR
jgi:hypothetical protein